LTRLLIFLQLPAALEVKPFDKPKMITLAGEWKLIEEIMLDDSFASAAASLARPARSFLEGPTYLLPSAG
jgi:hypothetical protein